MYKNEKQLRRKKNNRKEVERIDADNEAKRQGHKDPKE